MTTLQRWIFRFACFFAAGGCSIAAAAAGERPNIIVILADDLGAKELGCYGNREPRTPHLDALARTGVKFETCFTSPVCHPTKNVSNLHCPRARVCFSPSKLRCPSPHLS